MEIKLNLIPEAKKEEIRQAEKFKFILEWEFQIAMVLVLFSLMLFGFYLVVMDGYKMSLETTNMFTLNNKKYEEIKGNDELFKKTNEQTSDLEKIQNDQFFWSKLFFNLEKDTSDGIVLNSVITKDFKVSLSGTAEKRDNLVVFEEALKKDECFSEIISPLSNLVTKEKVEFKMDLKIKKECIK